jgi:hypothetical protein
VLFDNKSLDMWGVQVSGRQIGWRIADGVMTNAPPPDAGNLRWIANNLVSEREVLQLQDRGGVQSRGRQQQRHLPPRPI